MVHATVAAGGRSVAGVVTARFVDGRCLEPAGGLTAAPNELTRGLPRIRRKPTLRPRAGAGGLGRDGKTPRQVRRVARRAGPRPDVRARAEATLGPIGAKLIAPPSSKAIGAKSRTGRKQHGHQEQEEYDDQHEEDEGHGHDRNDEHEAQVQVTSNGSRWFGAMASATSLSTMPIGWQSVGDSAAGHWRWFTVDAPDRVGRQLSTFCAARSPESQQPVAAAALSERRNRLRRQKCARTRFLIDVRGWAGRPLFAARTANRRDPGSTGAGENAEFRLFLSVLCRYGPRYGGKVHNGFIRRRAAAPLARETP